MHNSPTSARPFLLIELERCIDRIEKVYVSQVSRSELCLLRYKKSTLYGGRTVQVMTYIFTIAAVSVESYYNKN